MKGTVQSKRANPGRVVQPKARYFDRHKRYRWHGDWEINTRQRHARHVSGVIYDFSPGSSDALSLPHGHNCESGSWHGQLRGDTAARISTSAARAQRICMEACLLFDETAWDLCQDCSSHTSGPDYYMVTKDLWLKAHPQDVGMLCMSCLESRIGRPLVAGDFTPYPINAMNEKVRAIRLRDYGDASRSAPEGAGFNTTHPTQGSCAMSKATPLSIDLRAAASALRMGTADLSLADKLAALAAAVETPTGFTLRINGRIDHDTFVQTAELAKEAAEDMQYSEAEYRVVPLLCVPGVDPKPKTC